MAYHFTRITNFFYHSQIRTHKAPMCPVLLAMQALVWISTVQFGVLYAKLGYPQIFKNRIFWKNPVLHFDKYSMFVSMEHILTQP